MQFIIEVDDSTAYINEDGKKLYPVQGCKSIIISGDQLANLTKYEEAQQKLRVQFLRGFRKGYSKCKEDMIKKIRDHLLCQDTDSADDEDLDDKA